MDTNPTKLPDMGTLQAGTMDASTRCFDLLCFGKCVSENDLKLNIQSTGEPPNLITKNANGDIVFAEPTPMCSIQAPAGHNVWVNIELKTITTKASDYMCLGIKKRGEEDYYDVLHSENLSRYVDVQEGDIVELVPLISSTKLPTYTAVKAGDSAKITDENSYDFGSVYRILVAQHDKQWLEDETCDLSKLGGGWSNYGKVGVGSVTDLEGIVHENQLLAINTGGQLARSSDGIHWFSNGNVGGGANWFTGPVYGNGVWCVVSDNVTEGIRRSIDGGRTWSKTLANIHAENLEFADGVFMTIPESGEVYTSPDAECWTQVGQVIKSVYRKFLIKGGDKWICRCNPAYVYYSEDGTGTWTRLDDGSLYGLISSDIYGGCYVNGCFYVEGIKGNVCGSLTGKTWRQVIKFSSSGYNVTYYKNKLYLFSSSGTKFSVGLFYPDGTIESQP